MDIEHDPTTNETEPAEQATVTPVELDPSIDPNVLINPDGTIAAVESSPGTKEHWYSGRNEAIEGLPVTDALAVDAERDSLIAQNRENLEQNGGMDMSKYISSETIETKADKAGEDAMVEEVRQRAMNLPDVREASKELKKSIGDDAAAKFREVLEARKGERQIAIDAKAQAVRDKINSDTPLAEIVELPEAPATTSDTTESESIAA